ncbi:MAG: ubiquinone biosynthesis protein UbiB [Burkholderiales bacterium RIFCSPLOWO2_12_67_14]|nr:MAG: ubiquinone biosynthesis protein UbiB [Burkholderiales bacterium RIFCSPLOWO2_02_FULL_67_64]OGB48232.1 MAG: ubiquinone biosynthesis protein UbiB [Burkholderiales bacterium RIFCSPLOWO2_12_67_14]OGB50752.1 MAG: ubiquinone biosynthesis protein UbiB [Burkholderiales bacterium RIFCSPHIGHO2_12_FULL_67_38]
MLIETLGAARDMGRLNTILGVLIRHGFGDSVRRLGLADRLERAGHALKWNHAADLARLEPPVQVRLALEELGPTFVKLGQILAGRADLFGPDWIAEFEKLHSQVPAVPLDELRPQLREDLGDEPEVVFARFDVEPLAAASIAQVHRAQLHDGTEVVVKIRRPGITDTIEADLRLLARLAVLAEAELPALKPYRPQQLVRELARSLRRELDLASECRSAERIATNLASLPWIVVPRVHWAHTQERVNVQDYVGGVPGNQIALLDSNGYDRNLLARRGAQAVLKMIVQDGFFHADPHPGNVFYLEGNRIAFIDFGMVGRLSQRRREELLNLLLGLVERNPQTVADVLLDWTGDEHGVNLSLLETEIETFVDQYHGTPLAQLNLGQMLADVTAILREHHLGLPTDMALLIKAFITLEGMGRSLDPAFHMTTEALPMLRQVLRARYQPKVVANRAWQTLRRTLAVAEQLPHDVSRLLRNARRGRVHVGIELAHLKRVGDQIDRAANRLTMALVIAALIIGSSIVMTVKGGPTLFGLPAFGFIGFASAFVGGLWLVRAIWRSSKGRDVGDD